MQIRKGSTKNSNPSFYPSSEPSAAVVRGDAVLPPPTQRAGISSGNIGVRIAALFAAVMGAVNLVSAVIPSQSDRLRLLEQYSPLQVTRGGHLASALVGFVLLLLATALWRRKRVAWFLTLIAALGSVIVHLLKGLDYEEASLAAGLAFVLLIWRPQFHARSDPPSIRQAFQTMLAALLFTLAYGAVGFFLLDRHFRVQFGLWAAVRQTVIMFTQYYDPGFEPLTGFGRYFADSIYAVGALTTGYALLMLIRPVLAPKQASDAEWGRAAEIVEEHGITSLAPFALLADKLYFFSPGNSLVAYVVKGRAALALGDPIGPRRDAAAAIEGYRLYCSLNDWFPVFYQVRPDYLSLYRRLGFQSIQIGQEAIIGLQDFTLEGGDKKNIRTAVNRMKRLGCRADVLEPPHSESLLHELNAVSDEWLAARKTSEMRFSVGWFDKTYLNRCAVLVVRNPEGGIEAFANILREGRTDEVTADMMRHRTMADKGQMDYLFASLFEWAKLHGYARFSFGLSALSGIGERREDPAIERALHFAYLHMNQLYNFRGLHAYKAKFHPIWSPRFLIVPDFASLPAAGAAFVRANTGDDLLGGYLFHPN